MNWKTTLVLLVLAIGILVFYAWDVEKVEKEEEVKKQKEELVLAEEKDIMALRLERPGQPTIAAVRDGEQWNLTEPIEWPADKFAWDPAASSLASAKISRTFPDEGETLSEENLTAWGLNPAGLTVTATLREGSREVSFGFGNTLPNSDSSVYGTSSDLKGKAVVVPKVLITSASKDLFQLREKKYLNIHFERDNPTRIEVANKDFDLVAEKSGPDAWTIHSPQEAKGDITTIRKFVEKVGTETIKIIDDVSDEKLASVGLADHQIDSATRYKIGFGEEGTSKTFYVGKFDPTEGGHLGRREGTRNLFVIDKTFFDGQPTTLAELRPKKAITLQKWTVEVVSATSNGKPLYEVAKKDFKWHMVSPHSASADREVIDSVIDVFNDYKITGYVDSGSSDADLGLEVPILTLTIQGEESTETVHFGDHDGIGGIYGSWEGAPDRFIIDQGILDKVLLNPLDLLIPAERERIEPSEEAADTPEILDLTAEDPSDSTGETPATEEAPVEDATAEMPSATE